ncbi:hypothetical protein DXG03_005065 [Asterophora parasitica]|uniref:CUE domain-containing protein n=1 Tax=Asterophora parasitica TaxID=117018 RepID=A0A9P7GBZ1_9AGAR|nr:hypothetical protein DXG03_005065 [Asterophora parasitica]
MHDTDTLLALVSSLLTEKLPDSDAILEALVHCNGDVEATATFLNGSGVDGTPTKKRKRIDLDGWLSKSQKKTKPLVGAPQEPIVASNKPSGSSSSAVDLMSVLRPPPSSKKRIPQLPPLLLSDPAMVAQNTPCTLHHSVLPPELACKLFYDMISASRGWKRNKWWLFNRLVESSHLTAFFAREDDGLDGNKSWQEAAQFWYNGRATEPPGVFPPTMEEACKIVERIVNEQLRKRKRFPLEWESDSHETNWRANVAASNCYTGSKESVGFHSDQLTYLGPYPTIASLSLERFKHCVPPQPTIDVYRPAYPESPGVDIEPSKCRINITFRFYRPDFRPPSIPRCKCGVPAILRPDMKNQSDGQTDRYWWTCYAGAQNEGKGCNFWKAMDMKAEKRGCHWSGNLSAENAMPV